MSSSIKGKRLRDMMLSVSPSYVRLYLNKGLCGTLKTSRHFKGKVKYDEEGVDYISMLIKKYMDKHKGKLGKEFIYE